MSQPLQESATPQHLFFFESEVQRIAAEIVRWPDLETGGELFGAWTHSRAPKVEVALGPGPRAEHQSTAFYQDPDYLERTAHALSDSGGLQHIGEWHSHHQLGLHHPSGGDIATVHKALRKYRFPAFLLLIGNLEYRKRIPMVSIGAFYITLNSPRPYVPLSWVMIPGESPYRRDPLVQPMPRSIPEYVLRPHVRTMDELRGPAQPVVAPANAWYLVEPGQSLLKRAIQELHAAFEGSSQVSAKVMATNEVAIVVSDVHGGAEIRYVLGSEFPESRPRVLWISEVGDPATELDWGTVGFPKWSHRTSLVVLHRHLQMNLPVVPRVPRQSEPVAEVKPRPEPRPGIKTDLSNDKWVIDYFNGQCQVRNLSRTLESFKFVLLSAEYGLAAPPSRARQTFEDYVYGRASSKVGQRRIKEFREQVLGRVARIQNNVDTALLLEQIISSEQPISNQ